MVSSNIPSNLANMVAPFVPAGQRPVGQENASLRNSTFKPVEQTAKTAHTHVQLRDQQDDEERRRQRQRDQQKGQGIAPNVEEEVELYTADKARQPAPRGCLFDETV